jgi:hypothetical protein
MIEQLRLRARCPRHSARDEGLVAQGLVQKSDGAIVKRLLPTLSFGTGVMNMMDTSQPLLRK